VRGCAEVLAQGSRVALFAIGSMVETAWEVRTRLSEYGIDATVVNARFAMPFDRECIRELAQNHTLLVTMEENVASGGFGEHIAAMLCEERVSVGLLRVAIPDQFVEHGSVDQLRQVLGIDADSIVRQIRKQESL
jgi:1-deoxy-D-xylulose-5-phosphate synthase